MISSINTCFIYIIHFKLYVAQVESLCKPGREFLMMLPTSPPTAVPEHIHIPTSLPGVPEHIHIHHRDPNDAGGDTGSKWS
jgi:hypothetical protein